jgi:hypothetical protein
MILSPSPAENSVRGTLETQCFRPARPCRTQAQPFESLRNASAAGHWLGFSVNFKLIELERSFAHQDVVASLDAACCENDSATKSTNARTLAASWCLCG